MWLCPTAIFFGIMVFMFEVIAKIKIETSQNFGKILINFHITEFILENCGGLI
jgi:hypothetical protein